MRTCTHTHTHTSAQAHSCTHTHTRKHHKHAHLPPCAPPWGHVVVTVRRRGLAFLPALQVLILHVWPTSVQSDVMCAGVCMSMRFVYVCVRVAGDSMPKQLIFLRGRNVHHQGRKRRRKQFLILQLLLQAFNYNPVCTYNFRWIPRRGLTRLVSNWRILMTLYFLFSLCVKQIQIITSTWGPV